MGPLQGVYLKQMELGPMANYIYLVGSQATREVAVVDPAWDVDAILRAAAEEELKITSVLVTHYHGDHTNGIAALLEKVPAKVYIHKNDLPFMPQVGEAVVKVDSGDTLSLGDVTIEFLHTPGHTPGSQCFHVQSSLISGDTMFIGACGRCDGPRSSPEEMYRSLHNLAKLPDETTLFPGHNYADRPTSTIAHERSTSPFLRVDLQTFLQFVPGPRQRSF